jgi:ribonuclease BN (tRNA processing enzyme)
VSDPAVSDPAASAPAHDVIVRFHGTRGSIPSPDPACARTGGDTSCVEIACGDARIILDAGTGIRRAASAAGGKGAGDIDIFLTHFHWDHVQGLPFFAGLHDASARVRIHAPCHNGLCAAELLGGRLAPVYFPVPVDAFAAQCTTHALDDDPVVTGPFRVNAIRVRHPSTTLGLRVTCGDVVIGYVPDNELGDPWGRTLRCVADPPGESPRHATYDELCAFLAGADLLLHDAMFTDAEYAARHGWGHSTLRQAVQLARDCGAKDLRLFHHDPARTDDELDALVDDQRESVAAAGSALHVDAARDGDAVRLAVGVCR